MSKMALAPHSFGSLARHFGWTPEQVAQLTRVPTADLQDVAAESSAEPGERQRPAALQRFGAHAAQLVLEVLDGLFHVLFGVEKDVVSDSSA